MTSSFLCRCSVYSNVLFACFFDHKRTIVCFFVDRLDRRNSLHYLLCDHCVFFSWTCVYGEIINKLTKKRKLSKKHKLPTYLVIRLWLWKNINETTETLHVKWNKCVRNCITLELLYSAPLFRTYLIFNQFTVPSFLSITCFAKCTYDYSAQRAHSITIRRNNCHKKTIFKRKSGRTTD